MIVKFFTASSLLSLCALCLSLDSLLAQDTQTAGQEVAETALLLGQDTRIPELGPVEIEPVEAPGLAVVEDRHGFMWFGGNDGLYRYDGDEYIHYQHDPYDSTSLSENWVESLYTGSDGMIWIGTFGGGLNRFNPETSTFTHFIHEAGTPTSLSQDTVTVILEDSHGTLWVGTHGGLNRFNKSTETFTRYLHDPEDPNSLSNNQVRALYEDSEGTIWVGTGSPVISETPIGIGGLNRFESESETFIRYLHEPDDSTSLINNKVMSIYEDSRGTFWVGTLDNGLHSMNRETGRFTRHLFDPYNLNNLNRPFLKGTQTKSDPCNGFDCGGVTFIHEDYHGMLWIGTLYGGLVRYDPETGATSFHNSDNSNLRASSVWSIHESNDGTLWVGSWAGMHKIFASLNSFPLSVGGSGSYVSSLQEDNENWIWINQYWWLPESLDRTNGNITQYQALENDPNSLFSESIVGTSKDLKGDIWFVYGTGGISQYNKLNNNFEHYFTNEEALSRFYNSVAILADQNGDIWLGTFGSGLYQLNPQSETIVNNFTHNSNNSNSLSDDSIWIIYEGRDGTIWAGTQNGLSQIIAQQKNTSAQYKIRRFLESRAITSILEDSKGNLWVGTWGDGLYLLNAETGQNINYNVDDGLPSDKVAAILEDENGLIWFSSSEGQFILPNRGKITRFNTETKTFTNFSNQEGLPDIGFFRNSALKTHDGLLIFGGNGGITFFDPSLIRDPGYRSPKIALTGLRISNKEITSTNDSILTRPVYLENSIELTYEKNDFAFDYTAFSYSNQDQIQYQYQLEPYDSEWVNARSQRSARYSQIPPGEYQFRVRSIDSRGIYSVNEASLGITILSPWWRTWWAYGIYSLLFIAGVFALDRFQRRRLITKERERARERELKQEKKYSKQLQEAYSELEDSLNKLTAAQDQLIQQEKLASLGQLTAGIAHEIKNPLNFVNNFSDLSIELIEEARDEVRRVTGDGKRDSKRSGESRSETNESPFEGGNNGETGQGDDAISANNETPSLLLDILDNIETNLTTIHKHGSRADSIVKSMLQHSRGGSGKIEPTDLNALIKEYTNLAFHGMRASEDPIDVEIKLVLDEDVGEIDLIAEDFSRVILNLCNNAFDAMREKLSENAKVKSEKSPLEGGADPESFRGTVGDVAASSYQPKLTVRTIRNGDTVTIDIQDNGPGIPDEIKDKILQPFFTTKKGTAGTGLGLSITNDIILAHGGKLNVQSKDHGTIFEIKLHT